MFTWNQTWHLFHRRVNATQNQYVISSALATSKSRHIEEYRLKCEKKKKRVVSLLKKFKALNDHFKCLCFFSIGKLAGAEGETVMHPPRSASQGSTSLIFMHLMIWETLWSTVAAINLCSMLGSPGGIRRQCRWIPVSEIPTRLVWRAAQAANRCNQRTIIWLVKMPAKVFLRSFLLSGEMWRKC